MPYITVSKLLKPYRLSTNDHHDPGLGLFEFNTCTMYKLCNVQSSDKKNNKLNGIQNVRSSFVKVMWVSWRNYFFIHFKQGHFICFVSFVSRVCLFVCFFITISWKICRLYMRIFIQNNEEEHYFDVVVFFFFKFIYLLLLFYSSENVFCYRACEVSSKCAVHLHAL